MVSYTYVELATGRFAVAYVSTVETLTRHGDDNSRSSDALSSAAPVTGHDRRAEAGNGRRWGNEPECSGAADATKEDKLCDE